MNKTIRKAGPRMKESAQAIWLAGLGALATAGDEGSKIFQQLVKRGESVDKANRSSMKKLAGKVGDLRDDASSMIGTRVKKPLDKGMATALHRLGVPTRSEIVELTKRVEALTRAVEKKQKNGRRPHKAATATAG